MSTPQPAANDLEREETRMTGSIANHPVQIDEGVNRVFVGIPDVLPGEQLIRLQALSLAAGQWRSKADDEEITAILTAAARYAEFIANGP